MKKQLKRILYDVVGVSLIILSGLLGWLPGPGGIPLLVAGLAILAVHNKWAQHVLDFVQKHAENILAVVFPNKKNIIILHTICGLILVGVSLYFFTQISYPYKIIIGLPAGAIGAFQLIYANRFAFNKH